MPFKSTPFPPCKAVKTSSAETASAVFSSGLHVPCTWRTITASSSPASTLHPPHDADAAARTMKRMPIDHNGSDINRTQRNRERSPVTRSRGDTQGKETVEHGRPPREDGTVYALGSFRVK